MIYTRNYIQIPLGARDVLKLTLWLCLLLQALDLKAEDSKIRSLDHGPLASLLGVLQKPELIEIRPILVVEITQWPRPTRSSSYILEGVVADSRRVMSRSNTERVAEIVAESIGYSQESESIDSTWPKHGAKLFWMRERMQEPGFFIVAGWRSGHIVVAMPEIIESTFVAVPVAQVGEGIAEFISVEVWEFLVEQDWEFEN